MKSINILGSGTMGLQLAALFSVLGYSVTLWNRTITDQRQKKLVVKIKMLERALGRSGQGVITHTQALDALPPVVTIEALSEDLSIKRGILSQLKFNLAETGIFTNSSSLRPTEIHADAYALHFFNPIQAIKLLETTCPPKLQGSVYKDIFNNLRDAGFQIIFVMPNEGFVANYILFREISAVLNLADEFGYTPETIDAVQTALGRSISIFDIVNQVGVDITKSILDNLRTKDPTLTVPQVLTHALQRGILGKKNGTSIRDMFGSEE
jgi:3-hydroxyacyl-CoA dehydrogenase